MFGNKIVIQKVTSTKKENLYIELAQHITFILYSHLHLQTTH